MSIISYAQNFEDVMLWRALHHIEQGFYVDAGAYSPVTDSVTKLFYDNGWTGINIEPNSDLLPAFIETRPNDINLQVAVGDLEGTEQFTVFDNAGLSTFDTNIAEIHRKSGLHSKTVEVHVLTLKTIFDKYVPASTVIHFMKVDVEGYETKLFRGNDWKTYRPWILVVEATIPMSQKENYYEWEPLLENANYIFAYADGLNRFYVSGEHGELLRYFKYPPNVFDDIKSSKLVEIEKRATNAETWGNELNAKIQSQHEQICHSEKRAKLAEELAQQSLSQLKLAENLVCQAQQQSNLAENSAAKAEARARSAEERACTLEVKADAAEHRAHISEAKAIEAEDHARISEAKTIVAENLASTAETRAVVAENQVHNTELLLDRIYKSRSWKMTQPYRWLGDQTKACWQKIKDALKSMFFTFMKFVKRYPVLKRSALFMLRPFPRLKLRLQKLYEIKNSEQVPHMYSNTPEEENYIYTADVANLSPRARKFFDCLTANVPNHVLLPAPILNLNESIAFTAANNANKFFTKGLSLPEKDFTWTEGKTAKLKAYIKNEPRMKIKLLLSFKIVFNHCQRIVVKTLVGSIIFDKQITDQQHSVQITIPTSAIADHLLSLSFAFPNAISPQSLNQNADTRELAFALTSMKLYYS